MNRALTPADLAPPAAAYSLAIHTEGSTRWLHTSGIVATRPDGTIADDIAGQAATVWGSLAALLREADMVVSDVVSVTTYVVAGHDLSVVMAARDVAMAGHEPASTLVVVPALAQAAWKMEIAIVTAR